LAADIEVLVLKASAVLLVLCATPALASGLVVPELRLPLHPSTPRVALTFDACSGKIDDRILNALVSLKIKSTVFVTARWLKRNPQAIAIMQAHADLFEIENHGAKHQVAIDVPLQVFGVRAAGSPAALAAEVQGGTDAIISAFGHRPTWFRGATATYSKTSMQTISAMGYRIAGFSRLGDGGAMYSENRTAEIFAEAQNGDIIIAHINQPRKPAGSGVIQGIIALKARGFVFVTLNEGFAPFVRRMSH
jgi:peptidoglycan/xylan/chitin deacetylase (PgdA/CDA1 family)